MARVIVKIIPFSQEIKGLMKGTTVTDANPPGAVWFGAFIENNPKMIGCCAVVVNGKTARIKSLVVLKEFRGLKIGRALWDTRMNFILGTRVTKITGFASPYSQPIYLKAGFVLKRRIPRGERGETWFMELKV